MSDVQSPSTCRYCSERIALMGGGPGWWGHESTGAHACKQTYAEPAAILREEAKSCTEAHCGDCGFPRPKSLNEQCPTCNSTGRGYMCRSYDLDDTFFSFKPPQGCNLAPKEPEGEERETVYCDHAKADPCGVACVPVEPHKTLREKLAAKAVYLSQQKWAMERELPGLHPSEAMNIFRGQFERAVADVEARYSNAEGEMLELLHCVIIDLRQGLFGDNQ